MSNKTPSAAEISEAFEAIPRVVKNAVNSLLDTLTGEAVEQDITEQIETAKKLTGNRSSRRIVLESLRVANMFRAYGISNDEAQDILRHYAQYGLPKKEGENK